MARTATSELSAEGVEALVEALREVGISAEGDIESRADAPDVVAVLPDGSRLVIEVKAGSVPSPERVRAVASSSRPGRFDIGVFVGDEISPAVRAALSDLGWGWLDRRGHLRLRVPDRGLVIDTDVRPASRHGTRNEMSGVRGRGGLAYAVAALLSPDEAPPVRAVARTEGLAPSSVSAGRTALIRSSLLTQNGAALIPDLFWAVAGVWSPRVVALAQYPHPGAAGNDRLDLELHDPQQAGWALTDTVAAIAWGAPVVADASYPPDFYVPSGRSLQRALTLLGEAADFGQRRATVATAPLHAVTQPRFRHESEWLLTHPLFAALDLARDPSRGREVLESWEPRGIPEFRRVW